MIIKQIVCIGTSTGGPRALQQILPLFPKDFASPIFVVQHMPPVFTKQLADRLNSMANIEIKEAEHNEIVKNGTAYIAPGGKHMTVTESGSQLQIKLDETDPIKGHRPSVDRLFLSLKDLQDYRIITAVLTGMGSDGTHGLKQLKQSHKNNVYSIAESEKTSIVFGMPKSVIKENLADEVVELPYIHQAIMKQVD